MQVCRVNFQLEMFSQDNVILMPDNIKLLIAMTNQYVIAKGTLDFQDHGIGFDKFNQYKINNSSSSRFSIKGIEDGNYIQASPHQ